METIWISATEHQLDLLENSQLYAAGYNDAFSIGSPQCNNPKYLEGWQAACKDAERNLGRSLDEVINRETSGGKLPRRPR